MRILLVCAGGMSTSILMKKLDKYSEEKGLNMKIKAVGMSDYSDLYKDFDVILVGPQVSYRVKEIQSNTGLPVAAIPSFDYAVGNSENIFKLAVNLYKK